MAGDSRATHTPGFAWGTPEEFDAAKAAKAAMAAGPGATTVDPPVGPPSVQALYAYLRADQLVHDLNNKRLQVETEMTSLQDLLNGVAADIDEAVAARADARRVLGEMLDMVPAEDAPRMVPTDGIITTGAPRRL